VPTSRTLAVCVVLALAGCYANGYVVNRGLHYITDEQGNEQLVRSEPPAPAAYEAYLRARIALDREPAQLDEARGHILDALRWQDDPQLWTTLGEVEWRRGDFVAAERALDRALALRPGYAEAERLLASIHSGAEL
jgi:tetratricopeptide (TPR) repeat protein